MKNTSIHTKGEALQFNISDSFLLDNKTAEQLYNQVKGLPVIDPHNHVDPAVLAGNALVENIYQLWIKPDQYKSRAMRILGVSEDLITGTASDFEKYMAWARSLKHTVGNPLFHWSCMELKSIFGIHEVLTEANAESIWNRANELLQQDTLRPQNIISLFNIEMLCTSDDLLDTLDSHKQLNDQQVAFECRPSLRGDSIIAFDQPSFSEWMSRLESKSQTSLSDLDSYKQAIIARLDFFDEAGCLLSDHSLDTGFHFETTDADTASELYLQVLRRDKLEKKDLIRLQSHMLTFLGAAYADRKWRMQLHIGANRFTSSRLRERVGPAGGYASIGNPIDVESISRLLDSLDTMHALPGMILYNLNPADNAVLASLTGSFPGDGAKGKIQFGPAWWYNDHIEGIVQQLVTLSSYGLLSTSIGMTTDSRSILSFTRHDYFRRILCNLVGQWTEQGRIPADIDFLTELVTNISYTNIKNWLKKQ